MKKIYLFLALLFGVFGSTALFAQDLITPDGQYRLDEENPVITDGTQFSSPYSQNDLGGADGGNLEDNVLIDGNKDTYWHSYWGGGNVAGGTHYLQVDISTTYTADMGPLALYYVCRGADNDHTTKWGVYGTNNASADKGGCTFIITLETPDAKSGATCITDPFDPFTSGEFKYLRFYSEEEKGSSYGTRGYFHAAEFQLYPVVKLSDDDIIINMLYDAYMLYEPELIKHPAGDTPGRYPADKVDAFKAAINKLDTDNSEVPATVEDAQALIDACEAALADLNESKIPFSLESGYYRIKAGMEYVNGDMYMGGYRKDGVIYGIWGNFDLNDVVDAAQSLWKIDNNGDGTYNIVSIFHDGGFTEVARSTSVEMAESAAPMAFDVITTDNDGITYVNIRVAAQAANDFLYLHQGGHSNGDGTSGYLVGWCRTWDWDAADDLEGGILSYGAKASEWCFEPVDDSEAEQIISDFEPYKNKFIWMDEFRGMIEEAKPLIEKAKDLVDTTHPLITSASQMANYCGDGSEGQHIENLIDGNGDSFWHTDWHSAWTNEDHHFLQVELTEDVETVAFQIQRRNTTSGNQIDKWQVYGFDDDDEFLKAEDGEWLAELETPYQAGNNTAVIMSDAFPTNGHKYLRFYCAGTRGNDGAEAQDKFFHIAEFQLYPAREEPAPTSQYAQMGDVASNLEDLVTDYDEKDDDDIEYEDYLALKDALDAFKNFFVDPTELRQVIKDAVAKAKSVVEGTAPGFWSANDAGAFHSVVQEAEDYEAAGKYATNEVEALITKLNDAIATIDDNVIPVQEGKWYRIRYGSENEYAQYGWPTEGNDNEYWNASELGETEENMYNAALYGKYMIPATWEDVTLGQNDSGDDVNGHRVVVLPKEEIFVDRYVFAAADDAIEDKDLSLWRFIKVGDGFAIQNKATGLFMQKNGDIRVCPSPTIFTQLAAGYGQNSFIGSKLDGGETIAPMHLARNYNILTTWGSLQDDGVWQGMGGKDGRRACFFVEEVEDVAADFACEDFQINFAPGDIYGRCFPVAITVKDPSQGELWTVNSVECTDEGTKVTLAKIIDPVVPAGRPFLYIAAGEFDEEAEAVPSNFSFALPIITSPQSDGLLKGIFESKAIEERFLTAGTGHDQDALKFYDSGTSLANNRVYITPNGESFPSTSDLEIVFDDAAEDGIQTALKNVARTGDIYTVDGRLVGKGNLNDLKQKGIYILNGTKVIVK